MKKRQTDHANNSPPSYNNYMAQNNLIKIYLSCNYVLINIDTVNSFNKKGYIYNNFNSSDVNPSHSVHSGNSTSTPFTSQIIFDMLQNHFKSMHYGVEVSSQKIKYGRFRNTFRLKTIARSYIVEHITGTNGYPDSIKITYPDIYILEQIKQVLNLFPYYHIQEIEFTFDFYLKGKHDEIYKQLTKISHLKYSSRSRPVPQYNTTKYSNNIRFTKTKGGKIYIKDLEIHDLLLFSLEDGGRVPKTVARQELTYKRNKLKKANGKPNNLGIDTIDDLYKIDIINVIKPLEYKQIDYMKFTNMRRHCGKTDSNILKETMGIHIDILKKNIKETMKYLKENNINKYQLLKPHPFNQDFVRKLQGKSFLTGNIIQINPQIFFSRIF